MNRLFLPPASRASPSPSPCPSNGIFIEKGRGQEAGGFYGMLAPDLVPVTIMEQGFNTPPSTRR